MGAPRRTFKDSLKAFVTYTPSGKVKPQATILFCRQLASFVRVGVPVTTAIETFAEQATNARLREVYATVVADLRKGMRLSDAFSAHPLVFPRIISDMVRSAEITGNLDTVLRQAAKHIELCSRYLDRNPCLHPSQVQRSLRLTWSENTWTSQCYARVFRLCP
jgi:type IV pilus assembly protein PilC